MSDGYETGTTTPEDEMETDRLWCAFLGGTTNYSNSIRRILQTRDVGDSYPLFVDFILWVQEEGYQEGYKDGLNAERDDEPERNEGYE